MKFLALLFFGFTLSQTSFAHSGDDYPILETHNLTFAHDLATGGVDIETLINLKMWDYHSVAHTYHYSFVNHPDHPPPGVEYSFNPRFTPYARLAGNTLINEIQHRTMLCDRWRGVGLLSHVPEPDRWFLLAGLALFEWKDVSQNQLTELLPEKYKQESDHILTYRKNGVIYVNQSIGRIFNYDLIILWEALKSWLEPDETDMKLFTMRYIQFIETLNLNSFRVKNKNGRYPLTFLNWMKDWEHTMNPDAGDDWAKELTVYQGNLQKHKGQLSFHLRYLGLLNFGIDQKKQFTKRASTNFQFQIPQLQYAFETPEYYAPLSVKVDELCQNKSFLTALQVKAKAEYGEGVITLAPTQSGEETIMLPTWSLKPVQDIPLAKPTLTFADQKECELKINPFANVSLKEMENWLLKDEVPQHEMPF